MIYKIGSVKDIASVVFESTKALELVYHYASILTDEYGADRNIDTDDGGYILYATMGTNTEEIKAFFDYTKNIPEFTDVQGDLFSTLYMLSNDYGVVIVMSANDAPKELLKEFNT